VQGARGGVVLQADGEIAPLLGLVIDGYSNAAIARAVGVAPRTVAAHLEHILVKLAVPSRTLAAVRAQRAGCSCRSPR
jgi:DNA-binding NarL/FixJ family response regulator